MISVSRLPRSQHCARLSAGSTDGNPTQKLAAFVIERPRRHRDAKPTRPAGRNSELGQPHRRDRTDFSHARRSRRICCRAVHRRDTIDERQLHLGEPSVDGAIERTLTCQIRPLGVRGPYTAKRAAALGEHRTAVEHDGRATPEQENPSVHGEAPPNWVAPNLRFPADFHGERNDGGQKELRKLPNRGLAWTVSRFSPTALTGEWSSHG